MPISEERILVKHGIVEVLNNPLALYRQITLKAKRSAS
jgi:hypothetical protein